MFNDFYCMFFSKSNYVKFLFVFFFFSFSCLDAAEKKTICLNMIVKNEKDVICRCLTSLKPLIDYWVIVDTGSTDGTQELIKEFMKGIPGELHERPWKNFAHNRTEALHFAKHKADYVLIIDADEVFETEPDFQFPVLDKDLYYILTKYGGSTYYRAQLMNNALDWFWEGVLHEYLEYKGEKTIGFLPGIYDVVYTDGARSKDPKKYLKDVAVLEQALKEDPNNSRYVFYLAQSYRDANCAALAIKYYKKRVAMKGWDEEVFYSLLQIARLQHSLNLDFETVESSYLRAYEARPKRAETLYSLAEFYRSYGLSFLAYMTSRKALSLNLPQEVLFVENSIYDYGALFEFSINAYWMDQSHEAEYATYSVMNYPHATEGIKEACLRNLQYIQKQIEGICK